MRYLQPHPHPDSFDRVVPRALGSSAGEVAQLLDDAAAAAEEDAARAQRRLKSKHEGARIYRRAVSTGRA